MAQVIRKIDKRKKEAYLGVSELGKEYLERIGYYDVYPQYRSCNLEFGSEASNGSISFYLLGYWLFTVYESNEVEVNRAVFPREIIPTKFDIETKVRMNKFIKDLFYDRKAAKTVLGLLQGAITNWRATELYVRFQNFNGDTLVYTW